MKPGWKTTEFWMSAITMVGMIVLAGIALFRQGSDAAAIITGLGAALASVGYSMSRAQVKRAEINCCENSEACVAVGCCPETKTSEE
tara:strand:+ start:621 stop:881 length:261 start_codon:yes stop_codon:yes gene_type:complete